MARNCLHHSIARRFCNRISPVDLICGLDAEGLCSAACSLARQHACWMLSIQSPVMDQSPAASLDVAKPAEGAEARSGSLERPAERANKSFCSPPTGRTQGTAECKPCSLCSGSADDALVPRVVYAVALKTRGMDSAQTRVDTSPVALHDTPQAAEPDRRFGATSHVLESRVASTTQEDSATSMAKQAPSSTAEGLPERRNGKQSLASADDALAGTPAAASCADALVRASAVSEAPPASGRQAATDRVTAIAALARGFEAGLVGLACAAVDLRCPQVSVPGCLALCPRSP